MSASGRSIPADDLKAVQSAYHDYEARTYETKFKITYDDHVVAYARDRFVKAVPEGQVHGTVLEVGAGTGFFTVSLALAGCIAGQLHCTDISQGMLTVCGDNAARHGLDVQLTRGDAEQLAYDDASFDLVIGHAVLHHLPDPGQAIAEALRVLRPGGRVVIAGEPTLWGDRLCRVAKTAAARTVATVTTAPALRHHRQPAVTVDAPDARVAALEHEVDLHTFRPAEVERAAIAAGFTGVSVLTEELLANWWGWGARTVEGMVRPGTLGTRWAMGAYRGYRLCTRIDEAVLQPVVPRGLFYNLILTGRKPAT